MRRPARRYYGTARNAPTRPRRRRAGGARQALRLLLAVLGLLGAAWGADRVWLFLTTSPGFTVATVSLSGNQHADPERLRRKLDLEGRNVFRLDLEAARERLLAESWVAEAALRRRLPNAVEVRIVEECPAALERRGSALALLDDHGRVLEESVAPDQFSLPRLIGAEDEGRRRAGAKMLAALHAAAPDFHARVESIDASRGDRLVLRAAGHPPIHVAGLRSVDELLRYLERSAELARRFPGTRRVDARWRDRLYLGRLERATETARRPGPAAARASAAERRKAGIDGT